MQTNLEVYFKLLNNPKARCFKQDKIENLEEARNEIFIKKDKNDALELAVCLKHTNEFIGNLFGLWEKDTFSACWNFLPNYHRKGYAYKNLLRHIWIIFLII